VMYDGAADCWTFVWGVAQKLQIQAKYRALGDEKPKGKIFKATFWGAHQRFFRQMLMAAKVGGWLCAL
jgi:hypothetical protein